MHSVQVPVELQHGPRPAGRQARDDRRRVKPIGYRSLNGEALACKDFRETVGGGARAASRAGNLHERDGRLDKTIWIHCGAYFFNQIGRE